MYRVILLLAVLSGASTFSDYYWRPYDGEIPYDAIKAAVTGQGPVFIGRGPVYEKGVFIGEIFPGKTSIIVDNGNGYSTIKEHLEILCSGSPQNLAWVSTSSASLNDVADKIKGGYWEEANQVYYIGKVHDKGQDRIGKLQGFGPNYWLNVFDKDEEIGIKHFSNYQVLVFDHLPVSERKLK